MDINVYSSFLGKIYKCRNTFIAVSEKILFPMSRDAEIHPAYQWTSHLLWEKNVHTLPETFQYWSLIYSDGIGLHHNIPPLKIHFNIIFQFMPMYSLLTLSFSGFFWLKHKHFQPSLCAFLASSNSSYLNLLTLRAHGMKLIMERLK